ncbi:MAG: TetR/AcrR family transcriptional regulator [Reyranellaceae bacterium]
MADKLANQQASVEDDLLSLSIHEIPARRSQAERRGESDRRMLRAAEKLIARRGLAGTSLADVGLAAGYSRGLPVERFGSKLGLVRAVLAAMDGWFQAHLARLLEGHEGLAALELRVSAHLGSADRSATATAALYSIYVESLYAMPELQEDIGRFTQRWRDGIAADLRAAQRRGEIARTVDAAAEATFLLAAMRGLMVQFLIDRSTADLARSRRLLLAHLRNRVATVPSRRRK